MHRSSFLQVRINHWVALGVIFLLAFAVRVAYLQSRGAWYDEAFSIFLSEQDFGTALAGAIADVHPLLYYFALHHWFALAGNSLFAARFFSVFFGIATIPVVFKLVRELYGERAAVFSALVLAFAPFHIAYSQEARMYSQLGFFSALALYAFIRLEKNFERGGAVKGKSVLGGLASLWWVVFVLSGVGALYSHNLAFITLGGLGIWVGIDALRTRSVGVLRATMSAGIAMFFLWLPWLYFAPSQFSKIEQAYWVPAPTIATGVQTLLVFTFDFDNAAMPSAFVSAALYIAIILPALIIIESRRARSRRPMLFLAAMAILPVGMLYLLSQARPLYIIRGLMPAFLSYTVLVAGMLASLPQVVRYVSFGVLSLFLAALMPAYYTYASFPRSPFEQGDTFLRAQMLPGDAIVHDNKLSFFPAHLYDRGLAQSFIPDPPGAGSDTLALPTQRALGISPTLPEAATANASRVWFVIFQAALDQATEEGHVHPNKNWMDTHFRLVTLTQFNDLNVYLYQK